MLKDAARTVAEDAAGTNGKLTREERVRNAANQLSDYVYEWLLDDDVFVEANVRRHIEQIAASAMVAQHDADMKTLETVVIDVIRFQRGARVMTVMSNDNLTGPTTEQDQQFWQELEELASGKHEMRRRRRNSRERLETIIPAFWEDDNPWPRITALLKRFAEPKRPTESIAPGHARYPYYVARQFLWAVEFWSENYDSRDHQRKRIEELQAELAADSKERSELCTNALRMHFEDLREIDRLKLALASATGKEIIPAHTLLEQGNGQWGVTHGVCLPGDGEPPSFTTFPTKQEAEAFIAERRAA